jgi:hypothetical protein
MINNKAISDRAVLDAIEEQVGHYRRLSKLTQVQHAHVQQEQPDALMEVLLGRQDVMEQIARLEAVVAPARREWRAFLSRLPAPQRGRAEALVAETRALLEQITTADCNDALVLQQRRLDLGRQINKAANARQLNRNYAAAAAYATAAGRVNVQK